jgi:hypothetical protein
MKKMNHFSSFESSRDNYPIDYTKIAKAIDFYKDKGFEYIEVPWDTPKKYQQSTFIGEDFAPIDNDRHLVGSSEQSFIYLLDNNFIKSKPYISCSPCFRAGEIDILHQEYFMKVEIFEPLDFSSNRLKEILNFGIEFFSQYLHVEFLPTGENMYDIVSSQCIELGSYGIREYNGKTWIYGTAIAEPRLSKAILLESN